VCLGFIGQFFLAFKARGKNQGFIMNAHGWWMPQAIKEKFGVDVVFVTCDDVSKTKPDPEGVHKALLKMGILKGLDPSNEDPVTHAC